MGKKLLNRLKVVLAEKNLTNKWLAQQLKKNETTISRWCTNEMQPSLETLFIIGSVLDVDVRDLIAAATKNENVTIKNNVGKN